MPPGRTQNSPPTPVGLTVYPACAVAVVVRLLCDRINWSGVIDAIVPWDEARAEIRPSTVLLGLLMNLLVQRTPLEHVEQWAQTMPLGLLLGPGVGAEQLNDDACGRVLEKLARYGERIVATLAVRIRALSAQGPAFLHSDTTAFSLFGDYPDVPGAQVRITFGHSKAHRPDLVQVMLGLTVDGQGNVLLAQMLDGNQSDKAWHPAWIDTLEKRLPEALWRHDLYISDSAVITPKALEKLAELAVHFLGRLPENYHLCGDVKAQAWAEPDKFTDLGTFSPKKHATHYQAQFRAGRLYDRDVRCLVVHSDALDKRKEKALEREVAQERERLEELKASLEARRFSCRADAELAATSELRPLRQKWHAPTFEVEEETVVTRRPGRPKKDVPPPTHQEFRIQFIIPQPDPQKLQAERRRRSAFVLVTDAFDMNARELLEAYKGQDHCEHGFRWTKDDPHLDAFYVQKPDRVAGIGMLLILGLQLVRWMRSLVRSTLRDQQPLVLPDHRVLQAPSDRVIVESLAPIWLAKVHHQGQEWYQWAAVPPHSARILQALGTDLDDIFIAPT